MVRSGSCVCRVEGVEEQFEVDHCQYCAVAVQKVSFASAGSYGGLSLDSTVEVVSLTKEDGNFCNNCSHFHRQCGKQSLSSCNRLTVRDNHRYHGR